MSTTFPTLNEILEIQFLFVNDLTGDSGYRNALFDNIAFRYNADGNIYNYIPSGYFDKYFTLSHPTGDYAFRINETGIVPGYGLKVVDYSAYAHGVDLMGLTRVVASSINEIDGFEATMLVATNPTNDGIASTIDYTVHADSGGLTSNNFIAFSRPTSLTRYHETHYWWLNPSSGQSDPWVLGAQVDATGYLQCIGHEVYIEPGVDTETQIAASIAAVANAVDGFTSSSAGNIVTITCSDNGPAYPAVQANGGSGGIWLTGWITNYNQGTGFGSTPVYDTDSTTIHIVVLESGNVADPVNDIRIVSGEPYFDFHTLQFGQDGWSGDGGMVFGGGFLVGTGTTSMTLFIDGSTGSGISDSMPLYTTGLDSLNSSMTLFTISIAPSGLTPLYTLGHDSGDANVTLYIAGPIQDSGSLNLFTAASPTAHSGNAPLYIYGATLGDVFRESGYMSLVLPSADPFNSYMNLFIQNGDTSTTATSYLNLSLSGAYPFVTNSMALFVANSGINEDIPFYVQGLSIKQGSDPFYPSDGYVPDSGNMNLYIERIPNETMPLYIKCDFASGDLSLAVCGAYTVNDTMTLVVPDVYNSGSGTLKLFTFGF